MGTSIICGSIAIQALSCYRPRSARKLKHKAITFEHLRHIHCAIGDEAFVLILDCQTDSASATLAKKLDKDNPELKAAPPEWCRQRIAGLASGAAGPAFKNIMENEALEAALARPPKVKKPPVPLSSHW
jgi:hypothetical protein